MTIHFTLPSSLQVADCLPTKHLTYADDARYLISTIVCKTAVKDVDEHGYARLSSDILRRVMYQRTQPAVVRALVDAGVVETAPYFTGVKHKGYRLHKRHLRDRSVRIRCTDPRLAERIAREHARLQDQELKTWLPVHYQLAHEQEGLTIGPEADEILDALPDHCRLPQSVLVDRLKRRAFNFTVGTTGRVFGNFSNLKRELRAAVRLHGQELGGVDIVSSQPALLAALLLGKFPANGPNQLPTYKIPCPLPLTTPFPSPCLQAFAALVLGGGFYEQLVLATGLDRSTVKLAFLRDVVAKRGRYPSEVEQAFRSAFPSVHSAIRAINRDDHCTLIRTLQRLESWLVVEHVASRLLGKTPVVTLHDAIYCQRREVATVADAFREVFAGQKMEIALHVDASYQANGSQNRPNCTFQEN
jgi:hypothetical protein